MDTPRNTRSRAEAPSDTAEAALQPAAPAVADGLIAHARRELALLGERALSFRRLASAAGVSLATLSYHLGSKAQILQRLVEGERERDRVRHQAWLERWQALPRFDPAALAAVIELHLDESAADEDAGGHRLTSLIWADMILRAGVDDATAVLLRPWLQERRDFWAQLFAGRIERADSWADLVMGYVTDEGIHSLAIGHRSDYRLLRRMAIERIARDVTVQGSSAPGTDLGNGDFFTALVHRMDPGIGLGGADATSDLIEPGRRRDIAAAACEVILADGVQALTHRSVGERISVPASSVAYHFRGRDDLLWAGQQMVYLVAQGRLPPPDAGIDPIRVTARGTQMIALAAARDPSLAAQATDLRRLRGENLTRFLNSERPARVSALDGQAIALVILGATVLDDADRQHAPRRASLTEWLMPA